MSESHPQDPVPMRDGRVPKLVPVDLTERVTITGRVTSDTLRQANQPVTVATPNGPIARDPQLVQALRQLRADIAEVMRRVEQSSQEFHDARQAAAGGASTPPALDTSAFTRSVDAVREAIDALQARLIESAAAQQSRLDTIEQTSAGWHEVARVVEQIPADVVAQLNARLDAADLRLAERAESLHEHLKHIAAESEQRQREAAAALRDQLSDARSGLAARSDELAAKSDALAARAEAMIQGQDALGAQLRENRQAADAHAAQVTRSVDELASRIVKLDQAIEQVAELHRIVTALPARMDDALSATRASISERMDGVDRAVGDLAAQAKRLHEESGQRAIKADADLRENLSGIRRTLAVTLVVALAAAGAAVAVLLKQLNVW